MKFQFQQWLRAVILLSFAGLIFKLHLTGTIGKFINLKYVAFSQIASVLLVFLFFIQLHRIWISKDTQHDHNQHCNHVGCEHGHDFSSSLTWKTVVSYIILIVPLVTGFLLPAKTLDASIASKKGILLTPSNSEDQIRTDEEDRSKISASGSETMNQNSSNTQGQTGGDQTNNAIVYFDDLYAEKIKELRNQDQIQMTNQKFVSQYDTISLYPEKFIGKPIEMTGFIYKEDEMEPNQLVISRFIITHCVADAGVLGFLSQLDEAAQLEKDTWIQVQGVLDVATYGELKLPMIRVNRWKTVEEPVDPYVYP